MKNLSTQLFKSDLHFKSEDESFKRLSVFNFEYHFEESRKPLGQLLAFNEETLGPQHKIFRHVEADMDIVIVPLAGAILYTDSLGNEDFIATEHIRVFNANAGMSYTIENPYPDDSIQYLQIWIAAENPGGQSQQLKFDFGGKNSLFTIFSGNKLNNIVQLRSDTRGLMGIFDTKTKGEYRLENEAYQLFAFAINGKFEIETERLDKGDALVLNGTANVAFEALSDNALLILLEYAHSK